MQIRFVLPGRGLSGGIRVVVQHGNALLARGHDVAIVCLKWPKIIRPKALVGSVINRMRQTFKVAQDHLDDFDGKLLFASPNGLPRQLGPADVVLATHWLTADVVMRLPTTAGCKVYFIQGYEVHAFPAEKIDTTWRLPMRKLVVSRWLQELATKKFCDSSAIHVPNGLDTRRFDAPTRELRRPSTVGFMYSPAAVKGAALVRAALEIVRNTAPDLKVVSFGASVPTRAEPLPPGTEFFRRPKQSILPKVYAMADVWLCASEREGFSLPTLEAMACRCPVVSTDCGGPRDFVVEGKNGFLVPVGDAEAMAVRILDVIASPQRWLELSRAAYGIRQGFSVTRSAGIMEWALKSIVAQRDCAPQSGGVNLAATI